MASSDHNYVTGQSRAVHKNSHAVSYCLVAFKCLWLKAHFAPEFWAAVMSDCHQDKLERYMGVARSEGWRPTAVTYSGSRKPAKQATGISFDIININNLTREFGVTHDIINQGLIGIKKIGESLASRFSGTCEYQDIEHFLAAPEHQNKVVMERFIKLGAFKHLPGHENSRALWQWYQYRFCTGTAMTELRKWVNHQLLEQEGWDDGAIEDERKRQITEYRRQYPKRNKIPDKIINWKPKPQATMAAVMRLYPEDFAINELLAFEKEYLGYYLHSPLDIYQSMGGLSIAGAKQAAMVGEEYRIEVVILDHYFAETKNGHPYCRLTVSDGMQSTTVMVWSQELRYQDEHALLVGAGISMCVDYDVARNNFVLSRGDTIMRLQPAK